MRIVRFNSLDFIPASHEDSQDPGCLKKVLATRDDLPVGRVQMINWCKIPQGKSFAPHYHEKMVEVFIILSGKVRAKIDHEEEILEKGDMIMALEGQVHIFENISEVEVDYLAMGIVTSEGGKTVNV